MKLRVDCAGFDSGSEDLDSITGGCDREILTDFKMTKSAKSTQVRNLEQQKRRQL